MAKSKWSRGFSKVYNAILVSGPKIPKGEVKVFMHSTGINLLSVRKDRGASFFLGLDYQHMAYITNDRSVLIYSATPKCMNTFNVFTYF
jgi:hypothetical protein